MILKNFWLTYKEISETGKSNLLTREDSEKFDDLLSKFWDTGKFQKN